MDRLTHKLSKRAKKARAKALGEQRRRRMLKKRSKKKRKKKKWLGVSKTHAMLEFLRLKIRGPGYPDNRDNRFTVFVPEKFSLIDNLDASLSCIYSLLRLPKEERRRRVIIDQRRVRHLGLAANALFDLCAIFVQGFRCKSRRGYLLEGLFPQDERIMNLIKVMGITAHLKIKGMRPPHEFAESVQHFPLKRGKRYTNDQDVTASNLTRHLNNCFGRAGFELTPNFQRQILKWAGEVMTNAEEHSGTEHWYAMSYMAPIPNYDQEFVGICELVIFNFGKTIHESLRDGAQGPIKARIEEMVKTHTRKRFFSRQYDEENLWTLYAIQDGVSCRKSEVNDGGRGYVEIIEAFQEIGQTHENEGAPRMILISGSTQIVFNEKYRMRLEQLEDGNRHRLAFNAANSLDEKPDADNVHSIKHFFPGTLLALRFYVDSRFLRAITEPTNDV